MQNQIQSSTLPRTNTAGGIQVAAKQFTAHHQHTASWSYYPDGKKVANVGENFSNYYHLPAHARHSYHGHEAIYQNCHTMTAQQQQTTAVQQQQPQQAQHIHHPQAQVIQAQQINQFSRYARSPTRQRPESPPPLPRSYQTMVLIPYKANPYQTYGETSETGIYQRQNIVEYQQVNPNNNLLY
jgi:hypothetical protein